MFLRDGTPIIRFLILLICGILLALYSPVFSRSAAAAFATTGMLSFACLYFFRRKSARFSFRWTTGIPAYAAVFFLAYLITGLKDERNIPCHFRNTIGKKCIGYLLKPVKEKENTFGTWAMVSGVFNGLEWKTTTGKCLLYLSKDSASALLTYGDLIIWDGRPEEVKPPPNPAQFNYKSWLGNQQVYDQQYLRTGSWKLLGHGFGNALYAFSFSLRQRIIEIFLSNHIAGQDFAVLSALILGYEDEIEPATYNAYAASGTLHILSVSGLHVGILYIAIDFLLGFLNRYRRTRLLKAIVIILFLWFYALLTGLSPSVLRSATMLSFILVGKLTRQHTSLYNTLAASAFFLLMYDPYLIMQVGFQLSYLAVLGIIFLQPLIASWFDPPGWILRNVWSITSVSIAAQLATFPLGLYYFHQFPVYFLFANLLIIPISSVVIYGGILLLFTFCWITIGGAVGYALGHVVGFMNSMAMFIGQLPCAVIGGIHITSFETMMTYLCILMLVSFLRNKMNTHLVFAMLCMIAIITSQIIEAIEQRERNQCIVYSMRGANVFNIIDGKNNYVLASDSVMANEGMLRSSIFPYWWQCGLDEKKAVQLAAFNKSGLNPFYYRGFLQYSHHQFGFVSNDEFLLHQPFNRQLDFLVITGNIRSDLRTLCSHFRFTQLIIDSSVATGKANKLLEQARKAGMPVHSVKQEGAFVYDLLRN